MNTEILIGLIFIIIIIWVFISSRKRLLKDAKHQKQRTQVEKHSWSQEKIISYGQVQEAKRNLIETIEKQMEGQPDQIDLLKEIVEEWADLKVKSFHDRRSWIRKPNKK